MKKILAFILSVIMMLSFASCTNNEPAEQQTWESNASSADVSSSDSKDIFSAELEHIPDEYKEEISSGSIPTQEIEFTHKLHTKKAVVYLPPNYDENKQYNILYILPGASGEHTVIFENAGEESVFKNIIDHMIINGDIEPMIAVTPDIYPDDIERLNSENFDYVINDFKEEVEDVLLPTVESMFSTYAKSTSKEDLIASREHRAFAGCSMGGAICWDMLARNTEYFYYYAPTAAGSFETYYEQYNSVAGKLQENLEKLNYTNDDFFIFATDGTEDVTYDMMQSLIKKFKSDYNDLMIFTDNDKSKGNITYKVEKDATHNYNYMFLYLYNALKAFFPA